MRGGQAVIGLTTTLMLTVAIAVVAGVATGIGVPVMTALIVGVCVSLGFYALVRLTSSRRS
jgi:hypothetical protein